MNDPIVWTLTTVEPDQVVTTVHASETDALRALRGNFDPEGDLVGVADENLLEAINLTGPTVAYLGCDRLRLPEPACPISVDWLYAALDEHEDEDLANQITALGPQALQEAMDLAYEDDRDLSRMWGHVRREVVAAALDRLTTQVERPNTENTQG